MSAHQVRFDEVADRIGGLCAKSLGGPVSASRSLRRAWWSRIRSLPLEERHLLESQAGQDLIDPRAGQRPDTFTQAGLVDRRDLRHDYDALLGKASLAHLEQDIPRLVRP